MNLGLLPPAPGSSHQSTLFQAIGLPHETIARVEVEASNRQAGQTGVMVGGLLAFLAAV